MRGGAHGFTLIELLVTMLITLVILGALVMGFQMQYGLYKFQHRKADAIQDAEIVLGMLRDDIENALTQGGVPLKLDIQPPSLQKATTDLRIVVWEPDLSFWKSRRQAEAFQYQAERHYQFDPQARSLRLDRNVNDGGDRPVEVLGNVTFFQVWQDGPDPAQQGAFLPRPTCPNGQPYRDAPPPPPSMLVYTVLVEIEVPAGTRAGVREDHCGNPTALPRVLRYIQARPTTRIEMPKNP